MSYGMVQDIYSFYVEPEDRDDDPDIETSYCPNCEDDTAIIDGVTYYCPECGSVWESTAGILTPAEERAMWAPGEEVERGGHR